MKTRSIITYCTLLLLFASSCRNHVEVKTYWDKQQKHIKEEYQVLSSNTAIKDGPFKSYFSTGLLAVEKKYDNNKLVDTCKFFNENPHYRSEQVFYRNGFREGVRILYYPTGKWKIIEHYSHDTLNGEYDHYDENGKLIEKGNFKNGQMSGVWNFFYANSTQLKERVHFEKGQEYGYYESFYNNGIRKSDGYYKGEDNMDSLWHMYYETGELMEDGLYKDNWENGWVHMYDKKHLLLKEILYHKGKVVKYADYVKKVFTEHPENAKDEVISTDKDE